MGGRRGPGNGLFMRDRTPRELANPTLYRLVRLGSFDKCLTPAVTAPLAVDTSLGSGHLDSGPLACTRRR